MKIFKTYRKKKDNMYSQTKKQKNAWWQVVLPKK